MVGVQTMFRESESQTFPWSPPYVQASAGMPEVLLLNNLKWNQGLPVSVFEVEDIVRSRKKRAWEMYLASLHKTSNVKLKKKIISQIEMDDWEFISDDLEKANQHRMKLAKKVLDEQKVDFSKKLSTKVDELNKKINQRYNDSVARIEHERDKEIRRINNITKIKYIDRHEKKTIIDEFGDKLSDMYAFRIKLGYHRKNKSIVLCEDAYNKAKDDKIKQRKFSPPNRAGKTKKHNCLKELFIDGKDYEFDDYFNKLDCRYMAQQNKREMEIARLENRSHSTKDSTDNRSSRSTMQEFPINNDKDQDIATVEEKRQSVLNQFKETCLEKNKQESFAMNVNSVEQCLLGKLLDLLSKEQQRAEEEKRILTMALIAQAERWKREARVDGIRQKQKMRETIKAQILDQACNRIGQDIDKEFENVLRDSIMDTAVIQAEEDMRVKLLDIDRSQIPKTDDGQRQEEMIVQLKAHVKSTLNITSLDQKREGYMTDMGEIIEAVSSLYQQIISVAVELDNLIAALNQAERKESKLQIVEEKIKCLINNNERNPALVRLKGQIKEIRDNCQLHDEIENDIKKMDTLCDTVIEIANDLYENFVGDHDIQHLKRQLTASNSGVVDDQLMQSLNPTESLYIFKLFKLNHIIGNENEATFLRDSSKNIMEKAKELCRHVINIAAKMHHFVFVNEYDTVSQKSGSIEPLSTRATNNDGIGEKVEVSRMGRLYQKIMDQLSISDKIKRSTDTKLSTRSKIDVCKIKNEAAEMIESIVEIWLAFDSMIDQVTSTSDNDLLKEEIETKLQCILKKLEKQFGNVDRFIGMKEYHCMINPSECSQETEDIINQLYSPNMFDVEDIVDAIIKTSLQLTEEKKADKTDLTKTIDLIEEPMKSDVKSMANMPDNYLAIPQLLN